MVTTYKSVFKRTPEEWKKMRADEKVALVMRAYQAPGVVHSSRGVAEAIGISKHTALYWLNSAYREDVKRARKAEYHRLTKAELAQVRQEQRELYAYKRSQGWRKPTKRQRILTRAAQHGMVAPSVGQAPSR